MKYSVIAVDLSVDHKDVRSVDFESNDSLLDADIVIIDPSKLARLWGAAKRYDDGILRLWSRQGSDKLLELLAWRQGEIQRLLQAGKIIFTFMAPLTGCECQIRNSSSYRRVTNYDWVPEIGKFLVEILETGSGSFLVLQKPDHPMAQFFRAFRDELSYKAYLHVRAERHKAYFATTKTGHPVAADFGIDNGHLILLPSFRKTPEPAKLFGVLIQCARKYLEREMRTPPPGWVGDFELPGESEILAEISVIDKRISEEEERRKQAEKQLVEVVRFKDLLFEQGKPLEDAVIAAMNVLGFDATRLKKEDKEHDIVLESPEGRLVGEVEGKDNDAIHIDKLDQLSRVVDEDFEERGTYPDGLLIGNGYRLREPQSRPRQFTEKVHIAANRKQFILLTTPELFRATQRALANPDDEDFKRRCREALVMAKGAEVHFPDT
jgi:hypothetical protein